jgi:short-subunit dehydrogenase
MNIIITGTSSGIGYALVEELLFNYHDIYIHAITRNQRALSNLQKKYKKNLFVYNYNLSKTHHLQKLISRLQKISPIDIIINNAAVLIKKNAPDLSLNDFYKTYYLNTYVPFTLSVSLIPNLQKSNIPHVINIGSMGGLEKNLKFKGMSFYSSSKAALANITECLAQEFKSTGIHFNYLALGTVQTKMMKKAFPTHKALHKPKDIAKFIAHFTIHYPRFFNGQLIPVASDII